MKNFGYRYIQATLSLFCLFIPAVAWSEFEPSVVIVANLCSEKYTYVKPDQGFTDWAVCVNDNLFSAPTVDIEKQGKLCPLETKRGFAQAWNPESSVCFVANIDEPNGVFVVTRLHAQKKVRIDRFNKLSDAGCIARRGASFRMSPNGAYCLKDVGVPLDDNTIPIQDITDEYFDYSKFCKSDEDLALERAVSDGYQSYLSEVAYSLPNADQLTAEIETEVEIDTAQVPANFLSNELRDDDCGVPNVSRVIGITH